MGKVFLSYTRSNKTTVDGLVSKLEAAGYQAWIDRTGIEAGDQWRRQIVEAIREADALILVLSLDAVKSDNVRKELDLAEEHKIRIIPVEIQPVTIPDKMEYQLAGIQRINLYADPDAGFQQLLHALGRSPAKVTGKAAIEGKRRHWGHPLLPLAVVALVAVGIGLVVRGRLVGGGEPIPALARPGEFGQYGEPTQEPTPTPSPLGEFRQYGEPSQMNFQKFVGGYMISYQGITYALCSGDETKLRGKWVSDNIEWKEGDPVYPEVDGCPIIKEGELGPRYGFGKYWCKLDLYFRTCLQKPIEIGGEEQKPKVKIYSNGLSFEVTDYHSLFELTYDGQTNGTWQRLE